MKKTAILGICALLGLVYELSLGYSYSLSGHLAVLTQAAIHRFEVPTMLWFSFWAVIVFVPIAALVAWIFLRMNPRPLVGGIVLFFVPVLLIRLFGFSIWSQLDYEASYFVANYIEFTSVVLLPLAFIWFLKQRHQANAT